MVKLIESKLDTSLDLEDEIFLSFYLKGLRVEGKKTSESYYFGTWLCNS